MTQTHGQTNCHGIVGECPYQIRPHSIHGLIDDIEELRQRRELWGKNHDVPSKCVALLVNRDHDADVRCSETLGVVDAVANLCQIFRLLLLIMR